MGQSLDLHACALTPSGEELLCGGLPGQKGSVTEEQAGAAAECALEFWNENNKNKRVMPSLVSFTS